MLKKGDSIPKFELKDEEGKLRHIDEFLSKGDVVIFFYPMDFTPGCTKEACSFRDQYDDFKEMDVSVIGISADSPERHSKFKSRHNLPYTLLSDKNNKLRGKFGMKGKLFGLVPERTTYVVNREGTIQKMFDSLFGYEEHVKAALKELKLQKEGI